MYIVPDARHYYPMIINASQLFEFILLYDDQEVSAASPWSWHEAPTRLLDYPGAEQDQGFFDFCGLPCLSQWLGHDNPTAAQVKLFAFKSSCLALVHN